MWTADIDVYAKSALPPVLALFAVFGSLAALAIGVVVGFVRGRRREALAAAAEASVGAAPPPLVDGAEVVLSGIVRHFADHDVAVKVSVTQSGSEAESSGSWSYAWVEIDRDIVLAPFVLELADGKHVLVEPPRNVDVADALDQKVWIDRNRRILSAELVPGETIFARGRLERSDRAVPSGTGYRDVEWGWALRPSGGQMLLSSEPLGRGLRDRAAFHRLFAKAALVILLATQASLVDFYLRMAGHVEMAAVADRHEYTTKDSDGVTDEHYVIRVRGDEVELEQRDYEIVGPATTVPVRVASADNWELGAVPTIGWIHGAIVAFLSLAVWTSYRGRRRASRPWFRRKVNESGSGRLPDRA